MGKFYERVYQGLSLYVRHSAWLNTAPESNAKASQPDRRSRLERMQADRKDSTFQPPMPEVDAAYLVGYLFDAGPTLAGAMGPVQLPCSELLAWQAGAGIDLSPWEFGTLRRLSRDYLDESNHATSAARPPPFGDVIVSPNVNKKIDAFLEN